MARKLTEENYSPKGQRRHRYNYIYIGMDKCAFTWYAVYNGERRKFAKILQVGNLAHLWANENMNFILNNNAKMEERHIAKTRFKQPVLDNDTNKPIIDLFTGDENGSIRSIALSIVDKARKERYLKLIKERTEYLDSQDFKMRCTRDQNEKDDIFMRMVDRKMDLNAEIDRLAADLKKSRVFQLEDSDEDFNGWFKRPLV